jgi:NADPH:quinone reductase-like Zn-dependent oxidoreductase
MQLRPTVCLESISGTTTGEMLEYLGFGGTLILYGLLSEQPAGGIDTIGFIGKNLRIESYLLTNEVAKMTLS